MAEEMPNLQYQYGNVFTKIKEMFFGVEIEFQLPDKTVSSAEIIKQIIACGVSISRKLIEGRDN